MAETNSSYYSAMRRESLRAFFEASPTAKLLRSDLAPFVLDFLNRVFKLGESITIGHADFKSRLQLFQEEIHETEPTLISGPPDTYLTRWTDAGWLKRFRSSNSNESQFQLTPFTEEAIRFVDSALSRTGELVGTESRLRLVIETIEDIVRGASADPKQRLAYLRSERDRIDEQIEMIESGKSVQVYRDSQIREKFQIAVDQLMRLQSDFREVEDRFQAIARQVQQRQSQGAGTPGAILGFALDSEEMLKTQDEGISFFAFVKFLYAPAQQESLMKSIREVQRLTALAEQQESLFRVRRMVPSLMSEADKVIRTTARLSSTLRRLLDVQASAERLRLANVLKDIRHAALRLNEQSDGPKIRESFEIMIESDIEIQSPLSRTFWTPTQSFQAAEAQEHHYDLDQAKSIASAFAKLKRLDLKKLRRTIRQWVSQGNSGTLGMMLTDFMRSHAIEGGVVELLGYIQIAHDDGHPIDSDLTEVITLPATSTSLTPLRVTIPRVTLIASKSHSEHSKKPR